jgi:DNA replication protein DnaC
MRCMRRWRIDPHGSCSSAWRGWMYIDELGYLNLKPEQSNIFFKLMEERYRQHSTIITTNLVYDEWPNFLGSRPMVEALLSRLRHYCHTVTIDGPSLRDPQR